MHMVKNQLRHVRKAKTALSKQRRHNHYQISVMYKAYLVVQLCLDITDDLKYNKINKLPSVHLVKSVQLGLSQNNAPAPWVLSGSHLCLLCHS